MDTRSDHFCQRTQVALHREAGALGLGDLDGLEVRAHRAGILGVVVAGLGRDGHDAGVEDLEHLAPCHVDEGDDSLDGAGVPVVLGGVCGGRRGTGRSAGPLRGTRRRTPAGHGSICTESRSSMPRRCMAACQSGFSCSTARWRANDSSNSRPGRTPSLTTNDRTSPAVTETTMSATSGSGPVTARIRTSRSAMSPGANALATALSGSSSPM